MFALAIKTDYSIMHHGVQENNISYHYCYPLIDHQ